MQERQAYARIRPVAERTVESVVKISKELKISVFTSSFKLLHGEQIGRWHERRQVNQVKVTAVVWVREYDNLDWETRREDYFERNDGEN